MYWIYSVHLVGVIGETSNMWICEYVNMHGMAANCCNTLSVYCILKAVIFWTTSSFMEHCETLLWGRHCCEGDIVEPRNLNVDDNSIKIRSCYQEMLRYRNGTVYGVYTSLRYWIGDVSASILQGDSVGKVSSFGVESNWPLWKKKFIFTHVSASILQGDSVGNGNSYIYICISQYSTGWFGRKSQ